MVHAACAKARTRSSRPASADAQSCRSAVSGSTRAERRAGTEQLTSATPPITHAMAAYVTASVGVTAKSRVVITRVSAAAPAAPSARPAAVNTMPLPTNRRITSEPRAPMAMRMPISRRLCATVYETTPYTPTTASSSATPPNSPSTTR